MMRPTMSAPPPAPNGTITRTLCCGHSCAHAGAPRLRALAASVQATASVSIALLVTLIPPWGAGASQPDTRHCFLVADLIRNQPIFERLATSRSSHGGPAGP